MSSPLPVPGIEELRERIRRLEGAAGRRRLVLPFGIKEIDRHLPGGGLALGALHEVERAAAMARSTARPRRSLRRELRRARGERSYGASCARTCSPRPSRKPDSFPIA
jgi:hypothetical protein